MDYNKLLDVAVELGYRLALCGAETFRIEESIRRVMDSYGIKAEVFAIPNCLHVSIETAEGKPLTRMRRIGQHGNDLDAVEKYSNLSRRICAECPDPTVAAQWLQETESSRRYHSFIIYLIGNFLGACGFALLCGGSKLDCLLGGICGLIIGLVNRFMDRQKANTFFSTIAAAFVMALFAYLTQFLRLSYYVEAVIVGALMILVPGLLFTNALRDIIYGDINSGTNRIVQVVLIGVAIALGTGAAWTVTDSIWGNFQQDYICNYPLWIQAIACFVGCFGFTILFNIHGNGRYLCAFGGVITWVIFSITLKIADGLTAYFWGTIAATIYAECMARIRKYPAISYLVISIFPLVPGGAIYSTMKYAVRGDMNRSIVMSMDALAIAGIMAAGILLISTAVRIITIHAYKKNNAKKTPEQ